DGRGREDAVLDPAAARLRRPGGRSTRDAGIRYRAHFVHVTMTDRRSRRGIAVLIVVIAALAVGTDHRLAALQETVRLDSYAEWRRPGELIVDGQRVRADGRTRWRGRFTRIADVPLGDEVRVTGTRQPDGSILAREIDVRPNGNALFESEVLAGTNQLEGLWLKNGRAFEADQRGNKKVIGEIATEGRDVDRVRRLVQIGRASCREREQTWKH